MPQACKGRRPLLLQIRGNLETALSAFGASGVGSTFGKAHQVLGGEEFSGLWACMRLADA